MKDNYWIEIKCPTVRGKKSRTIAFRGTEEQVRQLVEDQKRKLHDKGHVNVSVKIFKVDDMFLIERF